jgi:hypothetical protein
MSNSKVLNPLPTLANNSNTILLNNVAGNIFMTNFYSPDVKKKTLIPAPQNVHHELINNKNRIKNHIGIYPIKSLLIIDAKDYKYMNFHGRVKVWLIFNTTTQVLDYVIQIFPENVFSNNKTKTVKNLILKLINSIDCTSIIIALIKFGININSAKIEKEGCKMFRWSFRVQDIPILKNVQNVPIYNGRHLSKKPPNSNY